MLSLPKRYRLTQEGGSDNRCTQGDLAVRPETRPAILQAGLLSHDSFRQEPIILHRPTHLDFPKLGFSKNRSQVANDLILFQSSWGRVNPQGAKLGEHLSD